MDRHWTFTMMKLNQSPINNPKKKQKIYQLVVIFTFLIKNNSKSIADKQELKTVNK